MKILYLFTRNWSKEVTDYYRGVVPSHRIFGYAELKEMGHEPAIVPVPERLKKLVEKPMIWKVWQLLYVLFKQSEYDCIFGVNEASVLPTLLFKWLGLVRLPVIIFNTGLMQTRNLSGYRKLMWETLLADVEAVVSQTLMELKSTPETFSLAKDRQHFIPMLVDVEFFKDEGPVPIGDYCLAVGTNEAKDYPTLMDAFPKNEKLIIVTDPYNAAIIEKYMKPDMPITVRQAVPIKELRDMYKAAKVIFNPLGDTLHGSGHTVVLENMVLGKTVIVTRVGGMIDYIEDNSSAIGVRPYDVEDWKEKIGAFLAAPEKFAQIGKQAQVWVKKFSSHEFARKLEAVAKGVVTSPISSRSNGATGTTAAISPAMPTTRGGTE